MGGESLCCFGGESGQKWGPDLAQPSIAMLQTAVWVFLNWHEESCPYALNLWLLCFCFWIEITLLSFIGAKHYTEKAGLIIFFLLCLNSPPTVPARVHNQPILQLRKERSKGMKPSSQDSSRLYLNPSDRGAKGQWPKTWGTVSVGRPHSWTPPARPECARGLRRLSVSRLLWGGRCGWTGLWTGSLWSLGCCTCEFLGRFSLFLGRKEREN